MAKVATRTLGFAAPFFCAFLASAQYGTAPSGYYPISYTGATFTGVVIDSTGDQIMMTQTRKGKVETFTGRLETGCAVPQPSGSPGKMTASDFPRSIQLTVFFSAVIKKVGGQKVKENQIIAVTFNEDQGQPIPPEKQKTYSCSVGFKAFRVF